MPDTPTIDTELGEFLHDNESEDAQAIADSIGANIRKGPLPALRDAHPKAHGCVQAEFHVRDDLPAHLAQGVFVPGTTYKAWIRFSNGNPDATQSDAEGDARGMAIKLLDVPGEKLLSNARDARSQDFVMINYPVFFVDDPARYLSFIKDTGGSNPFKKLLEAGDLGFRGTIIAREITRSHINSPLEARYWSMVPYRLGDPPNKQAVKFSARPQIWPQTAHTGERTPNFLRAAMIEQLAAGDAHFDFEVQVGTPDMSVEDSMTEWKEADAPFVKVATITIPSQVFATPERDALGEDLSFNPWHALPQHRPLGAINRVRRVVYETISDLRHNLNKTSSAG